MKSPLWHAETAQHCIDALQTDADQGLTTAEATRRLHRYGANRLPEPKPTSLLRLFVSQFQDFLVLLLFGAGGISFALGETIDGIAIVAILLLNAVFGLLQEYRAERSLQALRLLAAPSATVIRNGTPTKITSDLIVPGDIVAVATGDRLPADGRLLTGMSLAVDESLLTGESVPISKDEHHRGDPGQALADRRNMLFMGTAVTRGRGKMLVTATGATTEMGQIAAMLRETTTEPTPLQQRLAHLGKWLVVASIGLVTLVFLAGILRGLPPYSMFLTAVSLAVAAIPEGLPAVVTAALAIGVQRMSHRRAIVRRLPSVETLGCTSVICTDKTGTLTKNQMTVTRLYVPGRELHVSGSGYDPHGVFTERGQRVIFRPESNESLALHIGMLCNNAMLVAPDAAHGKRQWHIVGDPTEGALLVAAHKAGLDGKTMQSRYRFVREHPFDPQRRLMSVVVAAGDETYSYVKGAPGTILQRCQYVQNGSRAERLTKSQRKQIEAVVGDYAAQALRIIALAYRTLPRGETEMAACEQRLTFVGLAALFDPPRPDVKHAIYVARRAGISTVMLTGDHPLTAHAIGRMLGLLRPGEAVVTGDEIDRLSDDTLDDMLKQTRCFARVSPAHKLRIVKRLKRQGHIVAMTGDGVNDAPAITEADIGISMGQTGADVTKESSDLVLADDNYATIVAAVEEGRTIYANIRKFIRYLLGCNVGEVMAMLVAMLIGLPLPLLPLQILWMNFVTDGLPAIALGLEPPEHGLMQQPPRPATEGIFARNLLRRILVSGMTIGGLTVAVHAVALLLYGGDVARARTIAFTTLVLAQLLYAFQCRSEQHTPTALGWWGNRYLVYAVAVSFVMQCAVLYWPPLAQTFRTVPLDGVDWLLVGAFAGTGLMITSSRQAWRRKVVRRFSWIRT